MIKTGSSAGHGSKGGVALAAPLLSALGRETKMPAKRRGGAGRIALAVAAGCTLIGAVARLAWLTPPVQEWRLSHASLPTLLKERGQTSDNPRLLYYVGLRLNEQGRFAEAESNLQRAVGLDPDSARLRDEWTRSLLGTGQISDAFTQLRQFVGTHPNSAEAHLALGKFYFSQNSMRRADEECEQAVRLDAGNAEAWAFLSQAASQLTVPNRPLEAARKAVTLAPNNAGYHLLLANLLQSVDVAESGKEFSRAVQLSPANAAMHQQYAQYLATYSADPEHRRMAEDEARRALALDPEDGRSQLLLGRLLLETGRAAEAVAPLKEAATLSVEDPTPAKLLIEAFKSEGNVAEAAVWQANWQKRQDYVNERHSLYFQLGATPNSRELHQKLARLLGLHGDVEGSIRNYAAALHRPPDSTQTLMAAARDLTEGGFADRALPLAERAAALGHSSPEAHEIYADALLANGNVKSAIAHYNIVTNYAPGKAKAIQERVNRYVAAHPQPLSPADKAYREARSLVEGQIGLTRSPQRALELAEEANRLDPGNIEFLQLLLRLQFGARKMDDAIKTARQIVELTPYNTSTQALLGVMLAERASTPAELAEAETCLNVAKNSPQAAAQYRYGAGLLAMRRKDGPRAVAELTEAAKLDPAADITLYKLAQAEQMSGHADAAAKAMAQYEHLQQLKRTEFGLQGDIGQHPDAPAGYAKLAAFYEQQGRLAEAKAIRAVAKRRFSQMNTSVPKVK